MRVERCSRLASAVALSFALPGKETLCSCIWILYFSLRWPCVMNKTKSIQRPAFLLSIVSPPKLGGEVPSVFPHCLTHGVGPGFTVHLLPLSTQVLGDLLPPCGWSSRLNCPTITNFYRFPLILLDPLPKAWLPPLATGILSLCFLGSLFLHSWSAFRLQQLLLPLLL